MSVEKLRDVLLWSGVINYAMLVLWAALYYLAPGVLHWFGRRFRLSAEQFDAIQYGGMMLYKLAILLFHLGPYIALRIVG
ncbi:MAG TPA: hypothetical protein VKA46_04270 [Gemmataceae bacterium]|nr:hypothetical protein [Gemmataceae bacterium]